MSSDEKKVMIKQEKGLDSDSETEGDVISINIKTLDGRAHPLRVTKNITIADLKQLIQAETDVPVSAQRLIFKGKALKEDQRLSAYAIEEGHTIHMVARPPGEAQSSTQSSTQQPSSHQHPQPATTTTTTTGANTTGAAALPNLFGGRIGPNVMLSTIAIPSDEVTDINQLVASVVNSLGVNLANAAGGGGALPLAGFGAIGPSPANAARPVGTPLAAATISATSPLENIHQGINNTAGIITGALPTITNTEVPNRDPASTPNAGETLGNYISQYRSEMERSFPMLDRLSTLLRNESALQDPQLRNEAQQLAQSTARLFRTLGLSMAFTSNVLNSVQMSNAPGQALNIPSRTSTTTSGSTTDDQTGSVAGIPVFIHPPGSLPTALRQPSGNAQATTANQSQPRPAQQAPNPLADLMSSLTQNPTSNNPNENPLAAIGQMFAPMMQQITSSINTNVAQGNTPSFSNVFNSVLSTMFRPPAANTSPAPATSTASSTPISTASVATPTSSTAPQPMDIDPPERASTTTTTAASIPPINLPQDSGAIMAQMFQAVTQALSRGDNQPAGNVIRSVASSLDGEDEDTSPLGEMLQLVMDCLTIQEIMAVMGGNWEPLEKVQKAIREHIYQALEGDVSPPRLEQYSRSILQSVRTSLDEKNLPEEIKQRIIPGRDVSVTDTFISILTNHVHKLILLVMTPSEATNENPYPFANALRDWTLYFVGEFFTTLSPHFVGGIGDVHKLITFFLNQRFTAMDPTLASMSANIISQHIMATYNRYLSLCVHYPTEDQWQSIIEEDERRQATMAPQEQPFSAAYLSGVDVKKRKELNQQV